MSIFFLSIPPKKLSQSITSVSTAFRLGNIKSWKRNTLGVTINLAASDFGTQAFGCFRNDTGTIIEIFEFDPATIASTNITILKRGLEFNGNLLTETTAYKLDWSAGSVCQLGTDVPQLFQYLKEYIDAAAISGGVPASETAAGFVEEATPVEIAAETATGATGSKLIVTPAKLKAGILSLLGLKDVPTIETTAGVTHALTTVAGQRVMVWAKGYDIRAQGQVVVNLKYNSVTKDSVSLGNSSGSTQHVPFSLMYTETPGAGTQNITVDGGTSLNSVVIMVLKF